MPIAVFIFSFLTQTLPQNTFFTTTLEVLFYSIAQEFDNKSFGFNPSPAKPKLFRRNAYHSFSLRLREILQMSSRLHFHKHKTKIRRTMAAKKFQLPYTAVILLPVTIAEN